MLVYVRKLQHYNVSKALLMLRMLQLFSYCEQGFTDATAV